MDHQQERRERHGPERERAEDRRADADSTRPGEPAVRPPWFLVAGVVLSQVALAIWVRL